MSNDTILILDPVASAAIKVKHARRSLDDIRGKVIGFIDNGKPNFHFLVDDLGQLLVEKYGAASVVKHRKRGSVPVLASAMEELAEKCDAVITGSGD